MKTQETIERLIIQRNAAAEKIRRIDAESEQKLEALKSQGARGDITESFLRKESQRIRVEAETLRETAKEPLRAVCTEYCEAVEEWKRPDGSKLDKDDLQLMKLMPLDSDGYNSLLQKHKGNWVMQTLIKETAKAAGVSTDHIQDAAEKKAIMQAFELAMEHSLSKFCRMKDSHDQTLADMKSFVNSRALDALRVLEPIEQEQYDLSGYTVKFAEEQPVREVW